MASKNENDVISQAVTILRRGGLVAFPTETVYGLGADAKNPEAVARIFAAKGRPADHPVIVHLPHRDQLKNWVREINSTAEKLVQHFWPGPLTLIFRRAAQVLDCVTGGQETIGIRIPNHPVAQALLNAFNDGVAAPSANRFGRISPTSAHHVELELNGAVDLILDGGECDIGIESTIIDVSGKTAKLLRPGAITASQLSSVLGEAIQINKNNYSDSPRVSGMLISHYAPQTRLQLIKKEKLEEMIQVQLTQQKKLIVLARHAVSAAHPNLYWIEMSVDSAHYAHELYARLREADQLAYDVILVEEVPDQEAWMAIRDRLQKAAGMPIL